MAQEMIQLPHTLTLQERNRLCVTGVSEVVSFDENAVILHTSLGTLTIQGQQLQLKQLSLDGGQVAVDGSIASLVYEELPSAGGWLRRLLG